LSQQIVAKPSKALCNITSPPTSRQVFQTISLWAIAHLYHFFGFLRFFFFNFSPLLIFLGLGGLSVALVHTEKLSTSTMSKVKTFNRECQRLGRPISFSILQGKLPGLTHPVVLM